MKYNNIYALAVKLRKQQEQAHSEILKKYEMDFSVRYAHNSTGIEGNTLSLMETKLVLEDGISPNGKALREIYEVVNHEKAFTYMKKCIAENRPLDEQITKEIHALLMENIMIGGVYRNGVVQITGAQFEPPAPNDMYLQIKDFFAQLPHNDMEPVDLAAYTHAEFVRIHPFSDGNGRTSRLIMNYQLMRNGLLPVSISMEDRLSYYDKLETYALNRDLEPFAEMIADLEWEQLESLRSLLPPQREHGEER